MKSERFISLRELEYELLINFELNSRNFQFYKAEGLIPKPKKIGREAGYNKEYLFKALIALKKLQDEFHLGIKELRPIIEYCISKQGFDRLHKDLKKLELNYPVVWPDAIDDEESWGIMYINRKIRRLYLVSWQMYCEKKHEPVYTVDAVEAWVKHETVIESGFRHKLQTELELLNAGELSREQLVDEVKRLEKLPPRGCWR